MLLAEDDADLAELLVLVLEGDGHEVEAVSSGELLLDHLDANGADFDVVLADLRLGGLTALDVLARIERASRPAVVLMTGAASPEVVHSASELGVERVLAKPFDLIALRVLVKDLALRRVRRAAPDQHADPKRHA